VTDKVRRHYHFEASATQFAHCYAHSIVKKIACSTILRLAEQGNENLKHSLTFMATIYMNFDAMVISTFPFSDIQYISIETLTFT